LLGCWSSIERRTRLPMLVNTASTFRASDRLHARGTPTAAFGYRHDALVLENCLLHKSDLESGITASAKKGTGTFPA